MKLKSIVKNLTPQQTRIAMIATFPPRKCGIAAYTKDLTNGIQANSSYKIDIMAITEQTSKYLLYPRIVKKKLGRNSLEDYADIARYINKSGYDLVHIQHEFGLYGGRDGEYLLTLISRLKVPFIITFHTVLAEPDKYKKYIVEQLCRTASNVIVMAKEAKKILIQNYQVNSAKILVIPHGVPNILLSNHSSDNFKKQLLPARYDNFYTLGTFGFISPNKGLEYLIEAMPGILSRHSNVLLLISGSTHPIEKNERGRGYIIKLKQQILKYGLSEKVILREKFLSMNDIVRFLFATDIYITPYLDPEQITSGTLTYAIGAGKPLISTPYAYAKEIVGDKEGLLVPFGSGDAIADAVTYLLDNPDSLMEISANNRLKSEQLSWNYVGLTHVACLNSILGSNKNSNLDIVTNIKENSMADIEKNINNIE